jgi:hypothetical protein
MSKQQGYVGVLFDAYSDVVIEKSPVERETPDAAYRDALALIPIVNAQNEAYEDSDGGDFTIGRVDASYAFVQGPQGIEWDFPIVGR